MRAETSPDTAAGERELVTIGTIARPHGLSGAVVAHIDPTMTDELRRGLRLELRHGQQSTQARVRSFAPARSGVRLVLDALGDRDAAEAAVGAALLVARSDLRGVGNQVYLDSDILGCHVFTRDGVPLGAVAEILTTGANDVYVVQGAGGEILVPAIARAVVAVDVAERRITVEADALEYPAAADQKASRREPQS
ncbi:MAG TPA: ribosome maturation factor RimM [Candidatus Limnocylindrales bacterium]|nr:ribosome maturation factor RimM [Candidatus Limnocylindrales bacterium]